MAKLTAAEKKLLRVCKETIDSIIREWSDNVEADPEIVIDEKTRYRIKDRRMVEKAIDRMWVLLLNREDNVFNGVDDTTSVRHRAYRYAVDAYFDIYLGATHRAGRVGRPRTELQELCDLLKLRRQKKTIKQICEAIRLEPSPRNISRIGKRLQEAEKRCFTATRRA